MKRPIPAKAESSCSEDGAPPRVYTHMMIGTSALGHATAISPAASLLLFPVLSPMTQLPGSPARKRLAPVWQPTNHSVSSVRDACDRIRPRTRRRSVVAIAAGVVVSRTPPGGVLFNKGSGLSRRVTRSPMLRQNAVKAGGPPMRVRRRVAQVLSLCSTAALHISLTERTPLARFACATGAYQSCTSAAL